MTVVNPPGWLQNAGATHTAAQMRTYVGGLLIPGSTGTTVANGGVNPSLGNRLQVTQTGSPSMAILVRSGVAWVPGTESGTQGSYGVMNDADVTLSIATAHATLPRIDIVVFKVEDSQYSGSNNQASLAVVTGTPAGSPSAPSAPVNSITLAQVAVAAAASSITNANISDRRSMLTASGGVFVCTSSTRPTNVLEGQTIYETDTDSIYSYDGSSWTVVWTKSWMSWASYTPTVTGGGSATFSTQQGTWRRIGPKHVAFKIYLAVNVAGSGSSNVSVALPTTPNRTTGRNTFVTHFETAGLTGAYAVTLTSGSGAVIDRIRYSTSTNVIGSDLTAGRIIGIQGEYEEA